MPTAVKPLEYHEFDRLIRGESIKHGLEVAVSNLGHIYCAKFSKGDGHPIILSYYSSEDDAESKSERRADITRAVESIAAAFNQSWNKIRFRKLLHKAGDSFTGATIADALESTFDAKTLNTIQRIFEYSIDD